MVLEKINEVNDIKNLSWEELEVLSEEIREFLRRVVRASRCSLSVINPLEEN